MNPPTETFLLDSYAFHWGEEGIEAVLDRLHEEKDGLKCELSVSTSKQPNPGLLREGRFNLSSPTTRNQWVKALEEREPGPDWYAVFEVICAKSIRRWRQGEPIVDLADVEVPDELPYILHPLVVEGASTVLFADGGSGKSLIALALLVSVATGNEIIPGVVPQRCGPCIYWDWEWDDISHAERLQAICAGAGIDVPKGMIFYQRELTSVIDAIPRMRKRVAETGAIFGALDSLGFARGGDPISADLTTRTFGAIRTLSIPILPIDHVAKDAKDSTHSFGSAYTFNSARMMWRLDTQKEEGKDEFYAALVNTKANRKLQKPRGLNVRMITDEDERLLSVTFESTDMRQLPGSQRTRPWSDLIEGVIVANGGALMAHGDIANCLRAEGIDVADELIRVTLYSRKKRFVRVGNKWGLVSNAAPV